MAARTAVVAGTATAVSGGVQRRQQERAQGDQEQQQAAAAQQVPAAPVSPAPASGGTDLVAELQKLASLKDAGVLSDDEFAAAKAKLLS